MAPVLPGCAMRHGPDATWADPLVRNSGKRLAQALDYRIDSNETAIPCMPEQKGRSADVFRCSGRG